MAIDIYDYETLLHWFVIFLSFFYCYRQAYYISFDPCTRLSISFLSLRFLLPKKADNHVVFVNDVNNQRTIARRIVCWRVLDPKWFERHFFFFILPRVTHYIRVRFVGSFWPFNKYSASFLFRVVNSAVDERCRWENMLHNTYMCVSRFFLFLLTHHFLLRVLLIMWPYNNFQAIPETEVVQT